MNASDPRCVLYGSIPRTVRVKIMEGDLEWKGPRLGFVAMRFRRKFRNRSLFRKNGPEMHISSQRTIQTSLPFKSCLATTEASLPSKWSLASIMTALGQSMMCSYKFSVKNGGYPIAVIIDAKDHLLGRLASVDTP